MKVLFLTLFCILLIPLTAIQVSGNQSGSWTTANNPYILIGDVVVPTAQSLVIEPGVIVQAQGNYQLTVQGLLTANGTPNDSIFFNISTDNTGGIWKGIRLESIADQNQLQNCDIRHAENGINIIAAPASIMYCHFAGNTKGINCFGLGVQASSVTISFCKIEYSKENAIFDVENPNVWIANNDISNNGVASTYRAAIQLSIQSVGAHCSPTIIYNHIHHNRWQGITAWDITGQGVMEPQITSNIIEYNYTGVYLLNADGQVQNNQITNNFIPGNMNSGAGVMVGGATSAPMFYQNIITGNYTGFYLANNANPCIGDLTEDVVTYWGRNTISNNIDANNVLHSIVLYQYTNASSVVKAENNDWGTTDTLAIAQSITDHADDPALGIVDFMPLLVPGPVQSISGTITPLEGMLGCQVIAVDVSNPNHTVSTFMNVDFTYQIPLDSPGVFYVTAIGNMFEDIIPSMCGAYGDVFNPSPVEVLLTDHVENINIVMQPFPAYMFARIGDSFQQDGLTLYPYIQGLFVTPMPIVMNLHTDNTGDMILIHSFTDNSTNPPSVEYPTSFNSIFVPTDVLGVDLSWASSRMLFNDDNGDYELIPVLCTVVGSENLIYNGNIHLCWIIECRNQANELISKQWFAYSFGIMKEIVYNPPFLVYRKHIQNASLTADNSFLPLEVGSKWFYQYEMPLGPSELSYVPGDATNFFSWEPTTGSEPWTNYRFYEGNVMLAQLPITQTHISVLQDFYHTHDYYVTAWREGAESLPSNYVTIEAVPNSDHTQMPVIPKVSVYPNPCNLSHSHLNIKVELPKAEIATINIYNVRGQKVREIKAEMKSSQILNWDGRNEDHKQVNDGVYIVKMESKGKIITNKVVVIK